MSMEGTLIGTITRRGILSAGAASALAIREGRAQPLILRPEIEGVDKEYADYALQGPYLVSDTPVAFDTTVSRVAVFHPQDVEVGRLIVFSHGMLSDPMTYKPLLRHWATHGFVVAAPIHDDAVIEKGLLLRRNPVAGLSEWNVSSVLDDAAAWRRRVEANSACLDASRLIAAAAGMDVRTDRPVIAGHGFGAYVTQLMLGAMAIASDGGTIDLADRRFFSGIVLSPHGSGVMGLTPSSWAEVKAPVLSLVTEGDSDFTGQDAETKTEMFRSSPSGYKHLAKLKGGSSTTYTGQIVGTNVIERKLFEIIKAVTTAFIRAYGNYEEAAFRNMTNDFFERMSLGVVTESRR